MELVRASQLVVLPTGAGDLASSRSKATSTSARTTIISSENIWGGTIRPFGRFKPDGAALYYYKPTFVPVQIIRGELATGARALWREFAPSDPAGVYKIAPVCMTPDASAYAYNANRMLTDLYVAENLR
ncbi:MAG: eukaryotic-like serine/threonine-protein kinase [Thermoanaerobaculia bacterium]|nr:eukaryotic-like serine/threonine-protein kinase [Thermoanaerobaculia bacterium]